MMFTVISIIFWIVMLIKDTKEYIKESGHLTLIVVDTIFLSFRVWSAYCMLK